MLRFSQVDVFSAEAFRGNPVAVVHDADDVTEEEMRAFARWTNLSETTFLLSPADAAADYRLRIFTPGTELPFAGHPTIGSAHAWLEAGGVPKTDGELVQECGAGLVRLRRGERLAFAAPPLIRSGPVSEEDRERIARALRIDPSQIVDLEWIDNGPGWVGVLMDSADDVLALRRLVYGETHVTPEEAEALIGLDESVEHAGPEWLDLFVEAMTDFVIHQQEPQGYVSEGNAAWLTDRIGHDGRVKTQTELELLIRVIEKATSVPPSLAGFALGQVREAVLHAAEARGMAVVLTGTRHFRH